MNKIKFFTLLIVVLLAFGVAMQMAYAQNNYPPGTPPSPEKLEEIISTRGTVLVMANPEMYAASLAIPVTGAPGYFRQHTPPTLREIEAFVRTRGLALVDYWSRR